MAKLTVVSITILLTASIDLGSSQFAAIPQPKSIRNGALYHQEIFYGGNNQQGVIQHAQQPIFALRSQPAIQAPLPTTTTTSTTSTTAAAASTTTTTTTTTARPAVPTTTTEREFENTPRTILRLEPIVTRFPSTTTEAPTSEEVQHQAKSAHYNFGTSVRDTINDHEHTREEVRDGLKLKGMYSYSDGFFRRTVHYEADQDGYRVVKESVEPLNVAEGPKFNPDGKADVTSTLAGDYSITVDDFRLSKQQQKILETVPRS